MTVAEQTAEIAKKAKKASRVIASASPAAKKNALNILALLLEERRAFLLEANQIDIKNAKNKSLDAPKLNRLLLTDAIIDEMIAATKMVAEMPDPIGAMETQWQRPNGMLVGKMRIPLGVIAMIYEARPNVTIDAAVLCLKAGNAVILRGGSEALHSNIALAQLLSEALEKAGMDANTAQLITIPDHDAVTELCHLDEYIDVMIPRGGENLVKAVTKEATMPVLKHFKGICHAYIDKTAKCQNALQIIYNGKVQRPGVCNALECILVHKDVADTLLPLVAEKLGTAGVQFRACPRSLPLLGEFAVSASEDDFGQEFHDLILAVKTVDSMDDALRHIAEHGSNHTEIICTNDHEAAMRFLREADASMVGVNVSTRFNDGGQLGLGTEIGISTSKLHAYGPMGVKELTTTKFVVLGSGQVRV